MTEVQYLTPTEAGEYLRSSKSTLAKLRIYGSGPPFVRIGSAVRYIKSDLDVWMSASRETITTVSYRQGRRK